MTAELLPKEDERVLFLRNSVVPDPNKSHDYIIDLKGKMPDAKILLRYVPDQLIIPLDKFNKYLKFFKDVKSCEKIAGIILDDINNELLPSWIHVEVKSKKDDTKQHVVIEDSQPGWNNKELLTRLKRI